jgi:hypothetical protein
VCHTHHDLTKQRGKAPIGIECEAKVASLCRQSLNRFFIEAEVEDSVHHARHREGCARTDGHEQRILRIAKFLSHLLFDLLQTFRDLVPHSVGKTFVVFKERVARFGGDD